jgi:stage IV sporulation protein FB
MPLMSLQQQVLLDMARLAKQFRSGCQMPLLLPPDPSTIPPEPPKPPRTAAVFFAIQETAFDLKWRMFGIHVRVQPFFWVVAALLSRPFLDLGIAPFLIAIACIFLSILIHELGHVVVGRYFGSHGHIVLWAMGGLAIGSNHLSSRWQRVAVLFAGPFAQFLLLGIVYFGWQFLAPTITDETVWRLAASAYAALYFVNLVWPILNLLPIWPLDGGQITREWFTYFTPRNGVRFSLHLSIGVCLLLALHALIAWRTGSYVIPHLDDPLDIFFFGMFAAVGYQALQAENERTRWFDPWDHERW